jgi:hypothetical protein
MLLLNFKRYYITIYCSNKSLIDIKEYPDMQSEKTTNDIIMIISTARFQLMPRAESFPHSISIEQEYDQATQQGGYIYWHGYWL